MCVILISRKNHQPKVSLDLRTKDLKEPSIENYNVHADFNFIDLYRNKVLYSNRKHYLVAEQTRKLEELAAFKWLIRLNDFVRKLDVVE